MKAGDEANVVQLQTALLCSGANCVPIHPAPCCLIPPQGGVTQGPARLTRSSQPSLAPSSPPAAAVPVPSSAVQQQPPSQPRAPKVLLPLSPQFTKRVQLLLIPAKHQPDLLFLRHVPLSRVHLFTAIQLACLGLLWIIKSTPAAIIFPIMVTCGRVG